MIINNDIELEMALMMEMDHIINKVSMKLTLKLEEFIRTIVYESYSPKWYERRGANGGLLGNFEQVSNKIIKNKIISVIRENDPTQLELSPIDFVHGSYYWDREDIRDILSDIVTHLGLNENRTASPLFGYGPWMEPRDFWTPFLELFENGTVDRMIEAEMSARGLKYIKV